MMCSLPRKSILAITIIVACGQLAQADTKVIRNIILQNPLVLRDETISLEDDKDLVVKGVLVLKFPIPEDSGYILKAIIDYVVDKNGYRAKYTLTKEENLLIKRLNPSTLKTLGG